MDSRVTLTTRVVARLDDNPRYAGSAHDPEVARSLGYRGALIPGAFVYGYGTRLAVRLWGQDWIERGRIAARFRRPVYDGDALLVSAGPLSHGADGIEGELRVTNAAGEDVLVGSLGLPAEVPVPPAELPTQSLPQEPPHVAVGELRVGTPVGTAGAVLTKEDLASSRAAFGETEAVYERGNLAHSGCLVRLTMADTLRSFRFPMPVIFTAVEAQNYRSVRPGSVMRTSGRITAVYERNGKHYFDSEEYLIAEGQGVVARHLRTNLYAMEGKD